MKAYRFSNLISEGILAIGDGYRAKNIELGGDGPVFLRAGYVTDTHIDLTDADRFHAVDLANFVRKLGKRGDVVVTTKGNSTGRVVFIGSGLPAFVYSPHLSYWRSLAPTRLHPRFLYYWASSKEFRDQLEGLKASTDMAPYLSLRDQNRLQISLPSGSEQRGIAEILGAFDDKIELNRKMNRTLEAMAQALFKSWFVDFDGRDDLVDSELGPAPEAWQLQPVNQLIDFNPRLRIEKGQETIYLEMKAVPTVGCSVTFTEQRPFKGGGSRFQRGDTLLARITPCLENGKTALVDFLEDGEVGFGSTEFIVMRPVAPVDAAWVYCLARSQRFRDHAIGSMTGSSGRQRVPIGTFEHFLIPTPPTSRLVAFRDACQPLFQRIRLNAVQSRTLAEIRDALLPKLISGEIRVPKAERMAEAAL